MQLAGWDAFNADQLKTFLRLSSRLSPTHRAELANQGSSPSWPAPAEPTFHQRYGHGFLDAYHAVKIAYKRGRWAIRAIPIKYQEDNTTSVLIQAADPAPAGIFWSLQQREDPLGSYWAHLRVDHYDHCEIRFEDLLQAGPHLIVGDFDGDGKDEIALQIIWQGFPSRFFNVKKHQQDGRWTTLGQSPNIPGAALGWPKDIPVSQAFAAIVDDSGREAVIVRQEGAINVACYDSRSDRWTFPLPRNYTPAISSARMTAALLPVMYTGELLHVAKFLSFQNPRRDALLVIGGLSRSLWLSSGQGFAHGLTASILEYDRGNQTYTNIPLDNLGNTHVILTEYVPGNLRDIVIADVDGDGDPEVIIQIDVNTLCLFDIHRPAGERTSYGYQIEISQVNLEGKISPLRHGDVDGNGREELAYLSESADGNLVRFLSWNSTLRSWQNIPGPLWHGRMDNRGIDVAVGDFNDDNIAEVGILMERPHKNIYRVFRMVDGTFEEYGLW
jgi:hypothetical protein